MSQRKFSTIYHCLQCISNSLKLWSNQSYYVPAISYNLSKIHNLRLMISLPTTVTAECECSKCGSLKFSSFLSKSIKYDLSVSLIQVDLYDQEFNLHCTLTSVMCAHIATKTLKMSSKDKAGLFAKWRNKFPIVPVAMGATRGKIRLSHWPQKNNRPLVTSVL